MSDLEMFFWERVDKKSEKECWPWIGNKNVYGYGRLPVNKKSKGAHRMSWELFNNKKIPKGLFICHTCDNPPCVNPHHLWAGTRKENLQDAFKKGRKTAPKPRYKDVTHCIRNHEFTKENTYLCKTGKRVCRICRRLRMRKILNISKNAIRVFPILVILFLISCNSLAVIPSLEKRTLRISPDIAGFEYQYEICDRTFLGICTKHVMIKDTYDLNDLEMRKKLINMNFVLQVRENAIP